MTKIEIKGAKEVISLPSPAYLEYIMGLGKSILTFLDEDCSEFKRFTEIQKAAAHVTENITMRGTKVWKEFEIIWQASTRILHLLAHSPRTQKYNMLEDNVRNEITVKRKEIKAAAEKVSRFISLTIYEKNKIEDLAKSIKKVA